MATVTVTIKSQKYSADQLLKDAQSMLDDANWNPDVTVSAKVVADEEE